MNPIVPMNPMKTWNWPQAIVMLGAMALGGVLAVTHTPVPGWALDLAALVLGPMGLRKSVGNPDEVRRG